MLIIVENQSRDIFYFSSVRNCRFDFNELFLIIWQLIDIIYLFLSTQRHSSLKKFLKSISSKYKEINVMHHHSISCSLDGRFTGKLIQNMNAVISV